MGHEQKTLRAFIGGVALLTASAAMAEGNWFVGVGLGQSENKDYECIGCGAPIGSLSDDGFAYKAFAGYRFNRYVAVQGGYVDLDDTTAAGAGAAWTDKLEVDGFYGALQGILPINESFDVFASAGLFHWDQTVTFNGVSGSFNGTNPMFGLGASYAFTQPGLKTQFEWTRFLDVGNNNPFFWHIDDYDLYTINLVYEF